MVAVATVGRPDTAHVSVLFDGWLSIFKKIMRATALAWGMAYSPFPHRGSLPVMYWRPEMGGVWDLTVLWLPTGKAMVHPWCHVIRQQPGQRSIGGVA